MGTDFKDIIGKCWESAPRWEGGILKSNMMKSSDLMRLVRNKREIKESSDDNALM